MPFADILWPGPPDPEVSKGNQNCLFHQKARITSDRGSQHYFVFEWPLGSEKISGYFQVLFFRALQLYLMVLLFEDRVHCRGEIWTKKKKKAVAVDNKKNRRTKEKQEERRIARDYVTRFFMWKRNSTMKYFWVPTRTDHAELCLNQVVDRICRCTLCAWLKLFKLWAWGISDLQHLSELKYTILHLHDKANEQPLCECVCELPWQKNSRICHSS